MTLLFELIGVAILILAVQLMSGDLVWDDAADI